MGDIDRSILFKRLLKKIDELFLSFMVVYLSASNVDFELRCIVVIIKPMSNHPVVSTCPHHELAIMPNSLPLTFPSGPLFSHKQRGQFEFLT